MRALTGLLFDVSFYAVRRIYQRWRAKGLLLYLLFWVAFAVWIGVPSHLKDGRSDLALESLACFGLPVAVGLSLIMWLVFDSPLSSKGSNDQTGGAADDGSELHVSGQEGSDCNTCGGWNPPGSGHCGECGVALAGEDA